MKQLILIVLIAFAAICLNAVVGITFSFANSHTTNNGVKSFYEFDVMACGTQSGTKLGTGIVLINYNTAAFGELIGPRNNNKITVTNGTLTSSPYPFPMYGLIINDNSPSRIAITHELLFEGNGNALPTTPASLLHIKIEISNSNALGNLSFDEQTMIDQQYYDDETTVYSPVIATSVLSETLPVELSSFSAFPTAQCNVNLEWTTESETGVLGFYLYRNRDTNICNAQLVSPLILATNTSQQSSYAYTDIEITEEGTYYYWLLNQDMNGNSDFHGPVSATVVFQQNNTPVIPKDTRLLDPYPNPFNPMVTINYQLAKREAVAITVYDNKGRLIRELLRATQCEGEYRVVWNGNDAFYHPLSSGIYYIKLQTDKINQIKKVIMLK